MEQCFQGAQATQESKEEMTSDIQKDIERLAKRCLKAGITPQIAVNVLAQAMQKEWFRTLIEAPGLAETKKG
jgi:hypothetical protein